jgi:cytochrome c oxidase subunit 1
MKRKDKDMYQFSEHPEVYILILPAFGIISHVIADYSNRPIFVI